MLPVAVTSTPISGSTPAGAFVSSSRTVKVSVNSGLRSSTVVTVKVALRLFPVTVTEPLDTAV